MERLRSEKLGTQQEITRLKATTQLDSSKTDLSTHPQFQRVCAVSLLNVESRSMFGEGCNEKTDDSLHTHVGITEQMTPPHVW